MSISTQPWKSPRDGAAPVATDCLYILRAAVGTEVCEPACVCDPAGGGSVAATDALACLRVATALPQVLECGCEGTTATTTLPPTTITTTTTTTGASTTTTLSTPTSTSTTSTTSTSSTTSTTSTTVPECDGGTSLEESCWYLAASAGVSCDAACSALGKTCDEVATRDIAGSGGTLANCITLVTALRQAPVITFESDYTFCGSPDVATGCASGDELFPQSGVSADRAFAPLTTCAADGNGGTCFVAARRICACLD